jgi:hypothetical protein
MTKVDVYGHIRFTATTPLRATEPDHWVLDIEGEITGDVSHDGKEVAIEERIGRIVAFLVQTTQVFNDGVPLYEVCDAHSAVLDDVCATVFGSDDQPKPELDIEPVADGLLHVALVEVAPEYRESGVAVQAVEAAIRTYCPGGIITAHTDKVNLEPTEWERLGFQSIDGSTVVYRDDTKKNPHLCEKD